ncbi:MAG: hypothetical protein Q8M01_15550 [Rubrivivax sp.]|nr:hypothetical protein [Rubrivivax sp.]
MKSVVFLIALAALAGSALAKLPAPVLTDEAKAKAAEAAARTAWSGKVDSYKLCKSMDQVASEYFRQAKQAGKDVKPPVATPPCTEPGLFAFVPPAAKPLEAAGAHSPPATATSPPSTTTPAAAMPAKK